VAARDETYTSRSAPSAFKTIQSQLADSVAGELESPTYLTQTPYGAPAEKRSCPESSHFPEPSCALLPMSAIITKESFGPDMTTIVVVGNVTCILLALRRAALVAWHVPALFRLGMHSYARHLWEQASFLSTRTSFLAAHRSALAEVLRWPRWSMLLYLFIGPLPCDVLSGLLVFSDRIAYPMYFSTPEQFGLSVLEDQQCAAR
jgi:hypothetical protein